MVSRGCQQSPGDFLQLPLMVEYEGVSSGSPAHQVLLPPDVGCGGVQHSEHQNFSLISKYSSAQTSSVSSADQDFPQCLA